MKPTWQRYAARIDAASLRERILVFAAGALAVIALLNFLLVEPSLAKQRRLSQEIRQRQVEIARIQEEVRKLALGRQAGPNQAMLAQLEEMKRRALEMERRLEQEQRNLVPPEQVGALVEEMLSRNRKLSLVEMKSLPVVDLAPGATQATKPAASKPAENRSGGAVLRADAHLYRHGVEITVTGGYMDLLGYLRDLEKLPKQMYWGQMDLRVVEHPQISLKLSVFTLSLDPAWLVV